MFHWIKKYPLLAYCLFAFGITWAGSLLYVFTLPKWGNILPAYFSLPGILLVNFGPFLAAILVSRGKGPGAVRALLGRFTIWKVGWQWYAFILCYPPALHLLIAGLGWLLGGPAPRFLQADGVSAGGNPWITLSGLLLFHLLVRGVGEETGWRGFALPHLQGRFSTLRANLLLGIVWAAWHFHPVNASLLSLAGIFVFLNIVATTFIFTWVYNHTQGSLLIAALFHMSLNVSEWLIPIGIINASLLSKLLQLLVLYAIVIVLALHTSKTEGQPGIHSNSECVQLPRSGG